MISTIYEGLPRSGKTFRLIQHYLEWIQQGISSEHILYLVSSSARKQIVLDTLKTELVTAVAQLNVYTFSGIVYNTLKDFWPLIEEKIPFGKPIILPELSGLEISEFLLRKIVTELNRQEDPNLGFEALGSNVRSLVTQLLRRYNLKADNLLTKEDLERRALAMNEPYFIPCEKTLAVLDKKTLEFRTFDRAKQINAFHAMVEHPVLQNRFQQYQYLLLDDIDEYTPAALKWIQHLQNHVKELYGTHDTFGSTRMGYLSAYPFGLDLVAKGADIVPLSSKSPFQSQARTLYSNIIHNNAAILQQVNSHAYQTRLEMIHSALHEINTLVKEGVEPNTITIITPHVDESLMTCLQEQLHSPYHILTGTYRPIENPVILSIITACLLVKKSTWELTPTPYEIRQMLSCLLKFDQRLAEQISLDYDRNLKVLPDELVDESDSIVLEAYNKLLSFVRKNASLEEPLYNLFIKTLKEFFEEEDFTQSAIGSINGLLNSIRRFSEFSIHFSELTEKDLVLQIKYGVVYDTPIYDEEIPVNAVIIATPQKYIDKQLVSAYQFWLDLKSSQWETRELAPLYNCWVHSRIFDYYSEDEHFETTLNNEKLARTVKAIMIRANKQINLFSSDLDNGGRTNTSRIIQYFVSDKLEQVQSNSHLLRQDQRPIIEYQRDKMAVSAVPGSGKTFVNVELIINLILKEVDPEGILVLTFMESAAATLRSRIQRALPRLIKMPTISTIHSLAYSIITDSGNMVKLGYSENLSICDDVFKSRIIKKIRRDLSLNPEIWSDQTIDKGISLAKSLRLTPEFIQQNIDTHSESSEYKAFPIIYKYYLDILKHEEMIDFDDQINFALDLLRQDPILREKYQQKYTFIIEDEAQDSSIMQQELIKILSEKHGNVVRTGDLNQAITSSFTAADVEGFRKFIQTAPRSIKMNYTQRCSKQVTEIANQFMALGLADVHLGNAFLENYMQPVKEETGSYSLNLFDTESEEVNYVIENIKQKLAEGQEITLAVLLRNNSDVLKWTKYLTDAGFPCLCFTERFGQFKVFEIIKSVLKVIYKPLDNACIIKLYKYFIELNRLEEHEADFDFLESLNTPFMNINIQKVESYEVNQLYYDVLYLLSLTNKPIIEIILNITHWLFDDGIDRSNGHLMAYIAKRYMEQYREEAFGLDRVIQFFEEMDARAVNVFQQGDDDESRKGFVQIMTMHKAKGQGFDIVYIPECSDSTYGTNIKVISPKKDDRLYIYLKSLKSQNSFLEERENHTKVRAEETLRLLYVGITRAKKEIHISCPLSIVTKYKKKKENGPSEMLMRLMDSVSHD